MPGERSLVSRGCLCGVEVSSPPLPVSIQCSRLWAWHIKSASILKQSYDEHDITDRTREAGPSTSFVLYVHLLTIDSLPEKFWKLKVARRAGGKGIPANVFRVGGLPGTRT